MLAYAAMRDISIEKLCRLSNLDLKALRNGAHPAITPKQFKDLWQNASHLSNDHLFGLHFGESMQLAALGIVGEIIKLSNTVGEALTHGAALIPLLTNLFQMEVSQKRQTFVVSLNSTSKVKEPDFEYLQMRDLLTVFVIHELDGLLLEKIKPNSVKLPFKKEDISEYERVFRCRPVNSNECVLEFKLSYWNEPILAANYELQNHLLQKLQTTKDETKVKSDLKERVQNYLMKNGYLGILSLEEVAANFNISARSLQRKLQDEGVTFQQLADAVRRSLAEHYLKSGDYQIKEISNMLGYNEMSAFSRAFKRWTGRPPVAY